MLLQMIYYLHYLNTFYMVGHNILVDQFHPWGIPPVDNLEMNNLDRNSDHNSDRNSDHSFDHNMGLDNIAVVHHNTLHLQDILVDKDQKRTLDNHKHLGHNRIDF